MNIGKPYDEGAVTCTDYEAGAERSIRGLPKALSQSPKGPKDPNMEYVGFLY